VDASGRGQDLSVILEPRPSVAPPSDRETLGLLFLQEGQQ
jgi:hypothetical protein